MLFAANHCFIIITALLLLKLSVFLRQNHLQNMNRSMLHDTKAVVPVACPATLKIRRQRTEASGAHAGSGPTAWNTPCNKVYNWWCVPKLPLVVSDIIWGSLTATWQFITCKGQLASCATVKRIILYMRTVWTPAWGEHTRVFSRRGRRFYSTRLHRTPCTHVRGCSSEDAPYLI